MKTDKKNPQKHITHSGIELEKYYTGNHLNQEDLAQKLGKPGEYPFTRGVYPDMYREKIWTMRQYAGFGTAEESNQRYRYLLSQGQTGLSVAFDLPTQIGLDSDHPLSQGEVGRVGVAIDTIDDVDTLFKEIPLDKVSVSMTINSTAAIILAMFLAVADKRGYSWNKLSGTIQNDLLKEYVARGTYIYPPKASLKIIVDIITFCQKHVPNWNTISISGYHIREAGATAVQELAFTFANAIAYVKNVTGRGLNIDDFAPRLSFFLASHNHFFEEIAKFRAARRIWARLMKEKFKAKNPKSWKFRFHTQTSGMTLLAQEPDNNVVRVTLQALAAVLGGTQSLHTNSRDEALALPSQESARIALRTQQIIAYESGVVDTVDPVGGSFFVEHMTDRIESEVLNYLRKIEDLGGVLAAIETGYIQREIQESAYLYQQKIEKKENIIVGLNEFRSSDEKIDFELYHPPPQLEINQINKLNKFRSQRDQALLKKTLGKLKDSAGSDNDLLIPIIDAVKAHATIGEISNVLREEFGEYQENLSI